MSSSKAEGAIAVFEPGRGDGGTIFVQQGGAYNPKATSGFMRFPAVVPPTVVIAVEHYGRLVRTLEKKVPVSVELTVKNTMTEDQDGMNVIAELPGTDKADGIVMLGAHFDGWHGGTGATNNAAGSAVMLEALRILKASGVKLRRTVRLGLWGGEEQGLIGSRESWEKELYRSCDDAGQARSRQDYRLLQCRQRHRRHSRRVPPGQRGDRATLLVVDAAVREHGDQDADDSEDASGTDQLSFDAVGIPGFQFIQDEVEYDTRTHHSNMDVWERLQAGDMMKNAVIVASFVYHAANRDLALPRKPLPKAQPPQTPAATPATQTTQN